MLGGFIIKGRGARYTLLPRGKICNVLDLTIGIGLGWFLVVAFFMCLAGVISMDMFKYYFDKVSVGCCDKARVVRHEYRFIAFLLVGGLNACFGYLVFMLFTMVGLHFTFASFISTVLGILFNYKTTGSIVFHSHGGARLPRFIGCYFLIYSLNCLGIWVLTKAGCPPVTSAALLLFPSAVLAFVLQKIFVFRSHVHVTCSPRL